LAPSAVLFTCNLNLVRSPMAAALLRRMWGTSIFVDSCGLRAAEEPDGFVLAVMTELGQDLSAHRPKSFDELEDDSFDLVISLTPEAHHRAVELGRARSTEIEYWPTSDPTLEQGSRDQRLQAYRRVRDELQSRLLDRFGRPSTFGG
jgi:protein-tyrosine-phosphatase